MRGVLSPIAHLYHSLYDMFRLAIKGVDSGCPALSSMPGTSVQSRQRLGPEARHQHVCRYPCARKWLSDTCISQFMQLCCATRARVPRLGRGAAAVWKLVLQRTVRPECDAIEPDASGSSLCMTSSAFPIVNNYLKGACTAEGKRKGFDSVDRRTDSLEALTMHLQPEDHSTSMLYRFVFVVLGLAFCWLRRASKGECACIRTFCHRRGHTSAATCMQRPAGRQKRIHQT